MNGPGEAAGIAFFKAVGFKAGMGMIGAALLYIVLPPKEPDGSFNEKEFVLRLAVAAIFSLVFGDMAADVLNHFVPWLQPYKHQKAVDLMTGAPGWWISRAVALWFYNRRGQDIAQLAKDVKEAA